MFLRPWPQGCGLVWSRAIRLRRIALRPDSSTPLWPRSQKHKGPANISSKRPLSRFDYENKYNENKNVQYIVRKKRKIPKKFIYEEEEETDSENDEIDGNKRVEETIEKKKIKKPNKKGVSKSIKM